FVSFDTEKLERSFTRLPVRDELYAEIDEGLVVEYYNQKL
ncbi:30S ribosomal protein S4, partial [Enterococcus faecalis]